MALGDKAKVFINGRLMGFHKEPRELARDLIRKRRAGKINPQINIAFKEGTNEVFINTDAGRVQRPLIVVEHGKSRIADEDIRAIRDGKKKWGDLVEKGQVEYLDAEEEENAYIAVDPKEVTKEHTHLEITPVGMFSIISSLTPYVEHNLSGRSLHGAKMAKQSVGLSASNYNLRTDTESHLLYYPQRPITKTRTVDLLSLEDRPQAQNFVVAIMPYYGFNALDAVVINRGSIERGLARSAYFRTYESEEMKYPGGQVDTFEIPNEETVGYLGDQAYNKLGEDGLVELETDIAEKDIIIGKTSPPRFLEEISEFGVVQEKRRESSTSIRKGKPGHVDRVVITEGENGNKLVKIKVRSQMVPELGDKFASNHGQKGVVGYIAPEADMPFTENGMKPDLILNPHSIPSRMTVGHLLEMLAGKAGSLAAQQIDGTAFSNTPEAELRKIVKAHGFREDGKECFYDGITGEKITGEIFTGVISYRRLFHMVAHKIQSRSRGPVQMLTRQPTEGKEKEGGLRFGEMEGETLVGHGAAMLLQEKFVEDSDKATVLVCEECGLVGYRDAIRNQKKCPVCKTAKVYPVEMSYGFKLLLDELKALGVMPKLNITDKV